MPSHIAKKLEEEIEALERELTFELPKQLQRARAVGQLSESAWATASRLLRPTAPESLRSGLCRPSTRKCKTAAFLPVASIMHRLSTKQEVARTPVCWSAACVFVGIPAKNRGPKD